MNPPKTSSPIHKKPFFCPPTEVTVSGKSYPIRWDFETAFLFMEYVDSSHDTDEVFLDTILTLWYPTVPADRDAAMDAALRFYCGGKEPACGYYTPVTETVPQREELYLNFLKHFGIDLNRERLHWWTFRYLLEELRERRTPWIETASKTLHGENFSS